ncbi:putative elongator complex protein 4 [Harmonia axyridis]|uniref:putative elongator complex protein 4 n=1 Tax=Harmonia axyridis TaxID=115357 RepID=UPI001E277731|nr:putative elongator complex protein 4 [Harmonia axyridis]
MERKTGAVQIQGTKYVSQSSQMLVSSGMPALDEILGGGLPVGTVALIEEDLYGAYAKVMLKYFVAEGVVSNHSIFLASQDESPHEVIRELPAVIQFDQEHTETFCKPKPSETKMKIAFRYENLPTQEDEDKHIELGHFYDLTKRMSLTDIENTDIHYWNGYRVENCVSAFSNPAYHDLLRQIKTKIKEDKYFLKDNPPKKSILRIALHSLGSPLWLPSKNSLHSLDYSRDLDMFIFCLRALVRSALAVAVITIPSHLYREHALERCIHSSDISMRLQSFAGTELETNKVLSEYHGFFQLTKLAPINSFASKHPGSLEYVFKLRRKKFVVEKLHLPPDLEDSASDSKKEKFATAGCHGTNRQLLDF